MHASQVASRAFSTVVERWLRKSDLALLAKEKGSKASGSKNALVQECLQLYSATELMKRYDFAETLSWYERLIIASLLPREKSIQQIVSHVTHIGLNHSVLVKVLPGPYLFSTGEWKGYLARPVYKLRKKGIILLNRSARTYCVNPLVEEYFNEVFGSNADKLLRDIEEHVSRTIVYTGKQFHQIRKTGGLSSVHGIGPRRQKELETLGINDTRTFTMKSAEDLHQVWRQLTRYAPSVTEIREMQIHIQSLRKRKPIYFGDIAFPIGHQVLVLDLEYDHFTCVWLAGLLASDAEGTDCYQLFADKMKDEKENLVRFATLLNRYPVHQILTWDGLRADLPQLEEAWRRHSLPLGELQDLRRRHVDLLNLFVHNYRVPLASFGLKDVARYLGFERKHEDMDGLEAQMLYRQYLNTPKDNILRRSNIKQTLLEYNSEDLEGTLFVLSKLRSLANGD